MEPTRPLTGEQELKLELFLRAEELERLVAAYKVKLCGDDTDPWNHGNKFLEKRCAGEKRGQLYDIYMKKREEKLKEEWRAKGAQKESEMRAMMESLASASSRMMSKEKVTDPMNDRSRQTDSRKFLTCSRASSTSQSSATTTLNPTIRSSNLTPVQKENTIPSKGTSNETTLHRTIARSKSSSERMTLVKDIRASRAQTLRRNSESLGEQKDFMLLNSNTDGLLPPVHANHLRNGGPGRLLRKCIVTGPISELSTAKRSISTASLGDAHPENSIEILKDGNEHFEHNRFGSPKSSNSKVQNSVLSNVQDVFGSDSLGDPHSMNQDLDGKNVRARKKWGTIERLFPAVDASAHSTMVATKGIKKFLKIGARSTSVEIHNDIDDSHDSEVISLEDQRNSGRGQISSSFNKDVILHEQVNLPRNSSHFANLKERKKDVFRDYPKELFAATHPLFSFASFHGRENVTKS